MAKKIVLTLAYLGLCACGTASATPFQSTVAIIATTPALENLVQEWIAAHPTPDDYRIEFRTLAPLEVSQAILDGTAELAIVGSGPPNDVFVTPLYDEGIAVIVHPEIELQSISLDELEGLIDGRIRNWSELNGDDMPVQPVIPLSADETRIQFEQLVMRQGYASVKSLLAPTPSAMIQLVGDHPGAVGYLPFSSLADEARSIRVNNVVPSDENVSNGRYPLTIPVIAYASDEPISPLRDWILFIQAPVETPAP